MKSYAKKIPISFVIQRDSHIPVIVPASPAHTSPSSVIPPGSGAPLSSAIVIPPGHVVIHGKAPNNKHFTIEALLNDDTWELD